MTDEQIKMGIAGCLSSGIVLKEEAVFYFLKGVVADRDRRIAELEKRVKELEREFLSGRRHVD
jgi:hypothetical protein